VVQEVIRYQPMTRVPLAPAALAGLINLRGQVITAVDLRRRLGFPDRAADELAMDVIVRTRDGLVSLLVDRIGDVVEVAGGRPRAPATLGARRPRTDRPRSPRSPAPAGARPTDSAAVPRPPGWSAHDRA
jgi:chemotaxis signal transduction protein